MMLLVCMLALPPAGQAKDATPPVELREDLGALFARHGLQGTLWIEDGAGTRRVAWNEARADEALPPASTFKILNALIALETGAVKDADEVIPWDGVDRGSAGWNRDHSLRSALRTSAVWFYQEMARRVGEPAMRAWLERVGYGNAQTGGVIDRFWLDGPLRITARQQVEFLKRLQRGDLPFAAPNMATVREILVAERGEDYVLRAKTGWAAGQDPQIGWYVGWLERGDQAWFFALNLDIRRDEDAKARAAIVREALPRLGLLPSPEAPDPVKG